jgi:hypothetical protein
MISAVSSRVADTLRAATVPAIFALAAMILLRLPPAQHSFYPQCPVYQYLHLLCPGCGGTRALAAMLRGDFSEAMHRNALIALLSPFAAAYGSLCYFHFLQRKPIHWPQISPIVLYASLAVAAVFTVARNLSYPAF